MPNINYYTFRQHLFEKFGERVHRVPVDAGFTCPNRDGSKSTGGCIYCDVNGSGARWLQSSLSIEKQILDGITHIKKRFNAKKFIAYFQAFSNTYGSVEKLRTLYQEALSVPNVVGLSISTRPDTVPDQVLDMIQELAQNSYIWVEYGLQSIHKKSLDFMNRAHYYDEFKDSVLRTQNRSILTAAHIILGPPGESREDMIATADTIAQLPLQGIKIHHLYIPAKSSIADLYKKGKISVLDEEEYIELVVDVIEHLPPEMVIHRVMGESDSHNLIAPLWSMHKAKILQKIDNEFKRRGTRQGYRFNRRYNIKTNDRQELYAKVH